MYSLFRKTLSHSSVLAQILILSSAISICVFSQSPTASGNKQLALRILAAKTDDERNALFNGETAADGALLAKEILDETTRRNGKVPRAEIERDARSGLRLAESAGDKKQIGRAWFLIGSAQTEYAGEYSPVKFEAFTNGLEAANEAAAYDLAVVIIINIGQMQESKDKEIEWYESGIVQAEKYPDKKVLSNLLGRIGNAYTQKGEYAKAREYHARSLEIKTVMNDRLGIASTISNLGIIYGMQGDYVAALENFKQSYSILETLSQAQVPGLIQRTAKDLRNLGIIYSGMGDDARALEYYSKSLKMSEDAKYSNGVFGALFQLASLYNGRGDYELARQALRRAEGVSDDDQLSTEVIGLLANSYVGEGKYEKALSARLRQLAQVQKQGGKNDISETQWQIGNLFLLMHDADRAEEHLVQALTLALEIGNEQSIFRALLSLSKSKLMARDFVSALERADQAKEQFKKLSGIQENWEIYATKGTAYAGLGNLKLSQANFEKAIVVVEDLHRMASDRSTKVEALVGQNIAPFHSMVESMVNSGSLQSALLYAERAKARSLLDSLDRGKISFAGAMSSKERHDEQNLKNELSSLSAQIQIEKGSKIPSPIKLNGLEQRLADKRLEFSVFQDHIYRNYPELRVQRGEMIAISLEESATLLPDTRTAVAEFVVTEDKTFLFVITKNLTGKPSLKVLTVDVKGKYLSERIEAHRSKIANGDPDFQKSSRELYDLLLKPAATLLTGKTSLIVVPDGPLWNLPFQTLVDGGGKYLIDQASVSYAPSLTALREMSKKAKSRIRDAGYELVAFGNPIVTKSTSDRVKQVFMSEKLDPLPEAEQLVIELGKMYGPVRSKVFVGDQAREDTAKTEAPKYRIVQFATHGILNNTSPMYSHLVMAQNQEKHEEDGLLEAWELKALDLKADMVILTACETARGKISNGEGMIGMTWASFIAGAPTTVASQWKVEPASTTELMLEFHRQLLRKKRPSKAEALRRASLRVMRMPRYRHPLYWGGFVIVGDAS